MRELAGLGLTLMALMISGVVLNAFASGRIACRGGLSGEWGPFGVSYAERSIQPISFYSTAFGFVLAVLFAGWWALYFFNVAPSPQPVMDALAYFPKLIVCLVGAGLASFGIHP